MLDTLILFPNPLSSIDLSNCVNLVKLTIGNTELTSLDLSKNTALKTLNCNLNYNLTSLDLTNNQELISVECKHNRLTNLNLRGCHKLTNLNCSENNITSLDLTELVDLKTLDCTTNQLRSLDVSNNKKLENLNCSHNNLQSIDTRENTLLKFLSVNSNNISSLHIQPSLTSLDCVSNKLNLIDLYDLVQIMPANSQRYIRTQTLESLTAVQEQAINLSGYGLSFANPPISTLFTVKKGYANAPTEDYTLTKNSLTFHTIGDNYSLEMTNEAIIAQANYSAVVTVPIQVKSNSSINSEKLSDLQIVPNPVIDELNIYSTEKIESVSIFNLSGHNVLQTANTQHINVSHLASGIYVVKAKSETGEKITKLVKK